MTTFGIIGAGHIGSQIARAAIASGYDVVISNSRGPETLTALVAELGPNARAATVAETAEAADIAVVTIPFHAYETVPVAPLAGKIVIDTNNYYFERDGHFPEIDEGRQTVTGALQHHLADSRVAKGFNAIRSSEITTDGTPSGARGRRALATASDFDDAAAFVIDFYDQIGFDGVNIGPLAESWRVDRDMHAYGAHQTAQELTDNLATAVRPTS